MRLFYSSYLANNSQLEQEFHETGSIIDKVCIILEGAQPKILPVWLIVWPRIPNYSLFRVQIVCAFFMGSFGAFSIRTCTYTRIKIRLTQELQFRDHGQEEIYADWVLTQQRVDADFLKIYFFLVMLLNSMCTFVSRKVLTWYQKLLFNALCSLVAYFGLTFLEIMKAQQNNQPWVI